MTGATLQRSYFNWMYRLVLGNNDSFKMLLNHLHQYPFRWSVPMDANREADGINLRYRFGYETNTEDYIVAEYLDRDACSVLEMMAALYLRFEEQIEGLECFKPDYQPSTLFCHMLESLGLSTMTDDNYDEEYVDRVLDRFLDRKYAKNGNGGLFTVNSRRDMPSTEIWYQLMYWADENVL